MKKYLFLIFLFLCCFSFALVFADSLDSDKETKENKEVHPDYKKIVESKKDIGFNPDDEIFYRITKIILHQFYGSVTEKGLAKAVSDELKSLCEASGERYFFEGEEFDKPSDIYEKVIKLNTKIPKNLIRYCCISGLFHGTGDPYSSFLTPEEYSSMMESLQAANFGGIGIYLELDKSNDNILTIIEPIEGTPSWVQGLKSGDMIVEIDGVPTKGMDLDVCTSKLRGPKGTVVELSIKRKGIFGLRKYKIVRDLIVAQPISSKVVFRDIGYIRIRSFGRNTTSSFIKALDELTKQNIKALIIDLRNNGGGYVTSAIEISGIFIGKDKPIMAVKNKYGNTTPKQYSGKHSSDLPVVILVNKYSASASELTAGAFQDYKRAVIVGENSFGKGSIQQLLPLRDGSAFKVTVAHYCTPSGRDIDKIGLKPDVIVESDTSSANITLETNVVMQKAEEILRTKTK